MAREFMNIVIVGHVDHGKSTVIGRLLADTHSLPEGKLEQVRRQCLKNARPFEYAFLLDALKDEQAQGITIDTARCFFRTAARDYILIDAPGHVEFLKNMVSGAARAEAALLVIDAHEGIRENSRRHGYMLSMLGIKQVVVLINKMDLVGYDLAAFERIRDEYAQFLASVGITPAGFVPVAAREGANLVERAAWYAGKTVLEHMEAFVKESDVAHKPFRFPVQDVYKFTAGGDDRRILAGTVETGAARVGDEVVFLPSQKRSRIKSVEAFNAAPRQSAHAGEATGFTLTEEIYVTPGEVMCRVGDPLPLVGRRFHVHVFWMGKKPMQAGKTYKLKLATSRAAVTLRSIQRVLDAADLSVATQKTQIDRHDVAECVLETAKLIGFELVHDNAGLGRFVIVDDYEIAGGGIITAALPADEAVRPVMRARDPARAKGQVAIVGFGPGDPELLTLKADRLLRDADVIFYGADIDPAALTDYGALHEVLGGPAGPGLALEAVSRRLYEAAGADAAVVYLAGGDARELAPLEQALAYLGERGVPVEVVPGVGADPVAKKPALT